jgi:Flp pilus assembly protein TadG
MNRASKKEDRRGAAAAELAILLPLLVLLLLGSVDLGRFAYTYITVTSAARAGAAFGSMNPYTPNTYTRWQSQVTNAVAADMASLSGFNSSSVTVAGIPESGSLWRVEVTVPYTFKTILTWPGIPSSTTVQQKVALRGMRPAGTRPTK